MKNLKKKVIHVSLVIFALAFALLFVVKFGGPAILRGYIIESGIGDCRKIPIFCLKPSRDIVNPAISREFLQELVPAEFPGMSLSVPKGFTVIKETIKKVYYKQRKRLDKGAVIYLLHKKPGFFPGLFPNLARQGITDNYEFLKRTMYAKTDEIKNVTSAFFVVMKGIFVPDVGDQRTLMMAQFNIGDKRGFINYNLDGPDHYFDCNIVTSRDDFFKIYIKDVGGRLGLSEALAVISTVRSTAVPAELS